MLDLTPRSPFQSQGQLRPRRQRPCTGGQNSSPGLQACRTELFLMSSVLPCHLPLQCPQEGFLKEHQLLLLLLSPGEPQAVDRSGAWLAGHQRVGKAGLGAANQPQPGAPGSGRGRTTKGRPLPVSTPTGWAGHSSCSPPKGSARLLEGTAGDSALRALGKCGRRYAPTAVRRLGQPPSGPRVGDGRSPSEQQGGAEPRNLPVETALWYAALPSASCHRRGFQP